MNRLISCLVVTIFSLNAACAADGKWARLTGCQWAENESNDGDSFHVKYQGREFIFRLYFVDTCEDSEQIPKRVKEQAKFFGISSERVLAAGKAAQAFTHSLLAGRPFTVVTKWEDARGASRLPRNYAFVLFGEDDRNDLASTLAQNGFVRIYGMPADPPGALTATQFHDELVRLDAQARANRLGIFGDLTAGPATAGSAIGGGGAVPPRGRARGATSSAPILLPARSHPPDVVDNPADDELELFAIQAAEAPRIIESTIAADDFSEIPGWKPKSAPTPEATPR